MDECILETAKRTDYFPVKFTECVVICGTVGIRLDPTHLSDYHVMRLLMPQLFQADLMHAVCTALQLEACTGVTEETYVHVSIAGIQHPYCQKYVRRAR